MSPVGSSGRPVVLFIYSAHTGASFVKDSFNIPGIFPRQNRSRDRDSSSIDRVIRCLIVLLFASLPAIIFISDITKFAKCIVLLLKFHLVLPCKSLSHFAKPRGGTKEACRRSADKNDKLVGTAAGVFIRKLGSRQNRASKSTLAINRESYRRVPTG